MSNDSEVCDPFDLDREEFNPDMYMLRYTKNCTLPNLLARRAHVDTEIRKFSGKLQNLLYDNYQKFVDVTSVVSGMKTDFQNMEQEMDNLRDKMNDIGRTSSEILNDFRQTEGKLSKLLKCRNTMKKLVLLTDLVPTLRTYVDSGAYSSAAKHYLKAEHVLKKYASLPSLKGIANDCARVAVEVRSALRSKLNCEIYGKEELSDTLSLLLHLGENPVPLLKHFLICADKALGTLLTAVDETWKKHFEERGEDRLMNVLSDYVNSCCSHIEKMSYMMEVAKSVFLTRNDSNTELSTKKLLQEFFFSNMGCLSAKLLDRLKEKFQNIDDDFLSQVLDKIIRQCHVCGIFTPQISFYSEGMNVVLQVCIARCEFQLEQMKDGFKTQLSKMADEFSPGTSARNLVLLLKEWTELKLMSVLQSVICYIRPEFRCCREVTFRKMFCKVVVREGVFVAFFRHAMEEMWVLLSSERKKRIPQTLLCIVLAKFHLELQDIVPQFMTEVEDHLRSTSENFYSTSIKDMSEKFKKQARKIIELYVEIRCQNLTQMMQTSMDNRNWMTSKEPTRPRAVIKMIVNDIQEAKLETEKVFGSPARKRGGDIGSAILSKTYSADGRPERRAIGERVLLNKIFTESSEMSARVEPNTPSIVDCLLKKTLNSFVQFIRHKTLNHFGLQQIQIDVCYLHCRISELVEFDTTVLSLFDEIVSSACNRTFEPQLMNNEVVSFICANAL